MREPTEKQIKFAEAISEVLGVYPDEETLEAYSEFIDYYKDEYFNKIHGFNRCGTERINRR